MKLNESLIEDDLYARCFRELMENEDWRKSENNAYMSELHLNIVRHNSVYYTIFKNDAQAKYFCIWLKNNTPYCLLDYAFNESMTGIVEIHLKVCLTKNKDYKETH